MKIIDLGQIAYADAWHYQQQLFDKALLQKSKQRETENILLLCEHQHVITMGKHANKENLLFHKSFFEDKGISLFDIDRGGDVTYHGPGQIVGYPIFDLQSFDIGLKQYIYNLEEVIIRLLASYNISAGRLQGSIGVWLDVDREQMTRKIAAIGVRCSRFITMHGFALNVNTDLSYFKLINPCGFTDMGVTSMEKELGKKIDTVEIRLKLVRLFEEIFKMPF